MFRFIAFLLLATCILATPLEPTFSSCLSSFSPVAAGASLLNITNVYAAIVSGEEARQQGLTGDAHAVLRVDLVGVTGAELVGYDNTTNKLATLFTDTRAATFEVYDSTTWLCNSLFPSDLPTPYIRDNTTYCPLPAGDFAINLSIPLYHPYALTTLRTQVRVVDTTAEANNVACYNIQVSPYRKNQWYYELFLWLPVALAIGFWLVSWGARFVTGWIVGSGVAEYGQKESGGLRVVGTGTGGGNKREATMRKWGTMIISGLSGERLSVSGGLLRFVTPGVQDILFHIQYFAMLGMFTVRWPEFAYPIVARGAWASLVWNTTLIQGSNPLTKRVDSYPTSYTPSTAFTSQMTNPLYPLYLDETAFNPMLDLHNSSQGMQSFATAVGLRPQDLFGTCLVIFLLLTLAVITLSVFLWFLHGVAEYLSIGPTKHESPGPKRASLGHSPRGSLGGKEVYDPRNPSFYSDGPHTLPTQATLAGQKASARSPLRRIWYRFRVRGEAGAFHAAALYGNLIRLILIFHLPITIFSMYQLTIGARASIVSRVFAALAFAFISVLIPALILYKIYRTPSGKLYDATRTLLSLGPMYSVYVEHKQMYRGLSLTASLVVGIVVGAGQNSGLAQAVVVIIAEMVMLIVPGIWYPWGEGASMGAPNAFLSAIRLASMVLVMLLSPTVMNWIAYAILILQAIVFAFFLLMLFTKMIEGFIRLFGGVHFDESTHPLDGGLFAAIMDLDCLNPVRGGKAAARKRRKRGSRQLQRNVSAAGSLTTQMMLDRHSQGVTRPPVSEGSTPFLGNYPTMAMIERGSYFPAQQPPLGPPPLDRHSSESRSDERAGGEAIMDAWQPSATTSGATSPSGYTPPGGFFPSATSPAGSQGPIRSFSVVRGGRAEYDNPYNVLPQSGMSPSGYGHNLTPPGVPMPMASATTHMPTPTIRVSQINQRPMSPPHSRQKSSHAIIEIGAPGAESGLTSASTSNLPTVHPPGSPPHTPGIRTNNQGLRPPTLAIPKRRSLNDLKHDPSPDSQYSGSTGTAKKKAKRRSGGWFGRDSGDKSRRRGRDSDDDDDYDEREESDDETGPSRRRANRTSLAGTGGFREPAPFEPVPLSPLQYEEDPRTGSGGGWRKRLGLGKRKKSLDDFAEQARDENKARKAALAAESGALFAGVEAPTPPKSRSTTPVAGTSTAAGSSGNAKKGFIVNRRGPGQPSRNQPQTQSRTRTIPAPLTLASTSNLDASTSTTSFKVKRMGQPMPTPTPQVVNVTSPTSPASISVHPSPNPSAGTSNATGNGNGRGDEGTPRRSFKVIRTTKTGSGASASPSSSTFVVNRQSGMIGGGSSTTSLTNPTPTPMTSTSHLQPQPQYSASQEQVQMGYPPSSFVPISEGDAPSRPAKNPRRSSEEQ
ncbi:hypothetical protein IAR55_001511 [Kwoniella newhampshirensis]|uniref:ML-like domain-containing protein n=1 Tax=Kwoniella newhampshirensis TaxID=1651941 RepID=A0AAW0Z2D7_9TREE